jgi:heat shock protein HslJ
MQILSICFLLRVSSVFICVYLWLMSDRTGGRRLRLKFGFIPDVAMPRFHLLRHIAALLVALLHGCALAPAPEVAKPDLIPLPQGSWELVGATFAEHGRVPGAPRATVAFENGRVSAFSGCNTATGAVGGGDGQLEVKELAVTRRSCPEPLAWFESRFFKMLRAGPTYYVDDEVLAIHVGADRARFRRVP